MRLHRFISAALIGAVIIAIAAPVPLAQTRAPLTDNMTLFYNQPPDPNGLDGALVSLIGEAAAPGDTVEFCFYSLNRAGIVNALVAAHGNGQGATVRVIAEADTAYTNDSHTVYTAPFQQLVDAGIEVHTDAASTSGLMHHKFVVVNGEKVWTGSFNATDNSAIDDANNAILINSTDLAAAYVLEFEEMWAGAYGDDKIDDTAHQFIIDGSDVECYFSPSDGVKSELLAEINAAEESIHFLMFAFTDYDLADAMVQQALGSPAVIVQGVLDEQQGSSVYSQLPHFTRNGVPVRLDSYDGLLHHKVIIIDHDGADPRVITGSYNLSANAENYNDENTLIIHDASVAAEYHAIFQDIYDNHASPPPQVAAGRIKLSEIAANQRSYYFRENHHRRR